VNLIDAICMNAYMYVCTFHILIDKLWIEEIV